MKPSTCRAVQQAINEQGLLSSYETIVDEYIAPLAAQIVEWQQDLSRPIVVGINGAQGTGKSTLCLFLQIILAEFYSKQSLVLSIDDLYCTRKTRKQLAAQQHPLLITRGVPGTHQVDLGVQVLKALLRGDSVAVPRFDKSMDDQLPQQQWYQQQQGVDIVLFEGWCVGAKPQQESMLVNAVNRLERDEDSDGRWRRYVNDCLKTDYQQLFSLIDKLVLLKAPSMDVVFEWRALQEKKLADRLASKGKNNNKLMNTEQLNRFVEHYERLTRHMLQEMPSRADGILYLSHGHAIHAISGLSRYAEKHRHDYNQ